MNELKVFESPTFGQVRTIEIDGEPWFVGKDVAEALGYQNGSRDVNRHVDADDKLTRRFDGSGQSRNMTIINESGLYSLILSSKLPGAKEFKRWVTSEVIPSIRKTGGYTLKPASPGAEKRAAAMLLNAKSRTAKQMMALWTAAGVKPEYQALALGDYYREDGIRLPAVALQSTKVTYDKTTIAGKLGVMSKSGKPHAAAIGAIIAKLVIGDDEREQVPYQRNGHDGFDYQYTESVIERVKAWLELNHYPDSSDWLAKGRDPRP